MYFYWQLQIQPIQEEIQKSSLLFVLHSCEVNILFSPTVVVIFPAGIALYFLLNFVLHCSK